MQFEESVADNLPHSNGFNDSLAEIIEFLQGNSEVDTKDEYNTKAENPSIEIGERTSLAYEKISSELIFRQLIVIFLADEKMEIMNYLSAAI